MLHGFGLTILSTRAIEYIFSVILLLYGIKNIKNKKEYGKLIIFFSLFVFISCIYSYLNKEQNLFRTIINSYTYWGLLFYFILYHNKPDINESKKILFNLALVFCFLYILQWLIYPITFLSGAIEENKVNVDKFRMRLPGSLLCYILYFWGINKYLLSKHKKDLFLSLIGFLPILIMGFRSLIACTFICSLLMVFSVTPKITKTIKYIFIGGFLCLFGYMFVPVVNEKVNEMITRQETDNFENDDYIRFISLDYFISNTSSQDKIFGSGAPDSQSKYGKEIISLQEEGLFMADLGLIGLSLIIGGISVSLFIFIIVKCIIKTKNKEIQFIRYTLLSTLIASIFTSMEIFRAGNFIIIALLLYIVSLKNQNNLNHHIKNISI